LEKAKNSQLNINFNDPKLARILPSLKFAVTLTKQDNNLNFETVPLNARFLESQVFFDEKEESVLEEKENNSGEDAPLYYDINHNETKAVYLLKIPVAIHQGYLDKALDIKVSLTSPMEQVRNIGEPDDATFGGILNKLYETLSVNKDKKPYILSQSKPVKVTNIFDCNSNITSFGNKSIITFQIKNKLKDVLLIEDEKPDQSAEEKLKIYIDNVDFLLQNSVSKAQFDNSDTEKITPDINEAFSYKILGGGIPIALDEDSELNLVIMIDKEKGIAKVENKYLIFQCPECKKNNIPAPENTSIINTENTSDIEKIPKTPNKNPFGSRNESLSFKEVLGTDKSPLTGLDRSPPMTSRSKFDFNFFQNSIFSESKSSRTPSAHPESSVSPKRFGGFEHHQEMSPQRKEDAANKDLQNHNDDVQISSEEVTCKCLKLEDSGNSIYMNTPIIIKWSINHLFSTSSIYRVDWNFKDVEIINVTSRIASHYAKVGEAIEVEVEVENKSVNPLKLELIPPTEVLQHISTQNKEQYKENQNNPEASFDISKMEKVLKTKINNNQLMAIATEKSIPYGLLKNKEKKKMKMTLLPMNHGTVKLEHLIFYEQTSNTYIKVQVPVVFIVV